MLFIAGTKGETSTADTGRFDCPHCQCETDYHHEQVHKKATVFFVPVATMELLGEYIECQNCFTLGENTLWYENGQKESERTYKDGELDGLWTYWDEDGNKR